MLSVRSIHLGSKFQTETETMWDKNQDTDPPVNLDMLLLFFRMVVTTSKVSKDQNSYDLGNFHEILIGV